MASKTSTLEIPDVDEAKYKAAIDEGIGEIDRILKGMKPVFQLPIVRLQGFQNCGIVTVRVLENALLPRRERFVLASKFTRVETGD